MISIIIPTLNEELYLPVLLEALKAQTYKDFEVIVADANSRDNTRLKALEYGATVAEGGRPGVGRNNGVKVSKGDLLLFLDADIKFHETFLEEIVTEFNDRKLDIATSGVSKNVKNKFAKTVYMIGGVSDNIRQYTKRPIGTGACILLKRSVFDDLNGFNEKKELQEDWDFLQRAVKKGYKFRILKNEIDVSTRRFDNIGFLRLATGAVVGVVLIAAGIKSAAILAKLYGGWGEHDIKRKRKFRPFRRLRND